MHLASSDSRTPMFKSRSFRSGTMGEMLYQGKVKQVWSTDDPDVLEFRFTNQISVFDQIIPSLIPRKGESLNRTTAHWFKLVEDEGVCGTHLVEVNSAERCLVRKVEVIKEPGAIPRDMEWVFVPLEFICRHYLSGSAWRRFQRGELTPEQLGVSADCEYGANSRSHLLRSRQNLKHTIETSTAKKPLRSRTLPTKNMIQS